MIKSLFAKDFLSKHNQIKSIFTKALTDAKELQSSMDIEIESKSEKIQKIETEIESINEIKEQNSSFIENLNTIVN